MKILALPSKLRRQNPAKSGISHMGLKWMEFWCSRVWWDLYWTISHARLAITGWSGDTRSVYGPPKSFSSVVANSGCAVKSSYIIGPALIWQHHLKILRRNSILPLISAADSIRHMNYQTANRFQKWKKMMTNQWQPLTVCLKQLLLYNSALHPVESTSDKILLLKHPRCDAISWIHTTTELIRLEWSHSLNC